MCAPEFQEIYTCLFHAANHLAIRPKPLPPFSLIYTARGKRGKVINIICKNATDTAVNMHCFRETERVPFPQLMILLPQQL